VATPNPDVKGIFDCAAEIDSTAERNAYLDQACAGASEVRREVEALLRAYSEAGSFLDEPAVSLVDPGDLPSTDPAMHPATAANIGTTIASRYKLLQVIGEGGMGTVYLAEQSQPVRRMVAVKLVKAGMDSKQVLARFEAERQALALMDHPNIAKVLDGGVTEGGYPYFVMDLVKGVPLTQFCDEHQLNVADRLKAFQQVCHAVQHAHQKGIIHRDLKPSNVLVEEHDGQPVPRVIDFGLAKALTASAVQPLTDQSLFTQLGTILGTPLYMAPEQAELNALDVDTRADIYALGVILYELLTGTTPLEKQRIAQIAWAEICRVIREEEPQTPSARLSTVEAGVAIAAHRHTEPAKLSRFVRGDLDWIVMKALAKERERRYETANAFAADIERFLTDKPVTAGPPTIRYKVRKFVWRNRRPVAAAAVLVAALLVGIGGTTWGLMRANRADRDRIAKAEDDRKERVRTALEKGLIAAMSGDFPAAERAAQEAELNGASTGQCRLLRGQVAFYQGDNRQAIVHLEHAVALEPDSVAALGMLALALVNEGAPAEQHRVFEQLERRTAITPEDFLFKGLAESAADAKKGLQTLDEAVRLRPNSVAVLLARAEARASSVQQIDPDPKLADEAMLDAMSACRFLPNNAAALRTSLRVHLVAMRVYQDAGPGYATQFQAAASQAQKDYQALNRFTQLPDVANMQYYYIREAGTPDEALRFARGAVGLSKNVLVTTNLAQQLYLHGEYREAADLLAQPDAHPGLDWVRLLAVAETEGRPGALRLYDEISRRELSGWDVYNGLIVLYVLGDSTRAKREALEFLRKPALFPALKADQFRKGIEFLAGLLTREQFPDRSMNRADLSNAHLLRGVQWLSEGAREQAKLELEETVKLRVIDFIPYDVASLLLQRMKVAAKIAPRWPPWIE
jgi:tetratricopeptide (TPR) repeat protein